MPISVIDEPSCRCTTTLPLASVVALPTTALGVSVAPFSEIRSPADSLKVEIESWRPVVAPSSQNVSAAGKADQCRAARDPLSRILRAAPHGRVAAAGKDRLVAGGCVEKCSGCTAD